MKRTLIVVMLVVAALTLAGCGVTGSPIPDVKGMTVTQAEDALKAAGFEAGKVSFDTSATGAAGAVIVQVPAAGQKAESGATVAITIAGPAPVPTPSVSGLDRAKAEAALIASGLTVGTITEVNDATIPAGTVTSQTPVAQAEAPRGSSVALVVSKGPPLVGVPNVKGKKKSDATKVLEAAGFKVSSKKKDDNANRDVVLSQTPKAGTNVAPDGTVTITVSSGTPPRPSNSEAASAIMRIMERESPGINSRVSEVKVWLKSGQWWAQGFIEPKDPGAYEGATVIIYKNGGTWKLSDYGSGL